jgi:hypothetical protein
MLSALHTIRDYPFDMSAPVFARYPAMKFGDRAAAAHFAELLAAPALRAIAQAEVRDWVLTSPLLWGLPCGANLVCRALHQRLAGSLPAGVRLDLEIPRAGRQRALVDSPAAFERYNEYSKLDLKTRRDIQANATPLDSAYDGVAFRDRGVLFVNDINVTGTQVQTVERALRPARPAALDWLLIVNVEPEIGCRFPQLESEINNSKLRTGPSFTDFLRHADLEPTGKLVARLLSCDVEDLRGIFADLSAAKRELLRRAIAEEGVFSSEFFRDKLAVVNPEMVA